MTTVSEHIQNEQRAFLQLQYQSVAHHSRNTSREGTANTQQSQRGTHEVQIREMCHLVREQAFEKLETNIIVHVITQIIRQVAFIAHFICRVLRGKEKYREKVFKSMLGRAGVLKIYGLFNGSQTPEIRKLSGRLLIEGLHGCIQNQEFLCELLDFEPMNGRVCLNQEIPQLIKQKIQSNPSFLSTVHNFTEMQSQSQEKKYWSFPEFKEINNPSTQSQNDSGFNTAGSVKEKEQNTDYSNFPDSTLYLIGFKYKYQTPAVFKEVLAKQIEQREEDQDFQVQPEIAQLTVQNANAQNVTFQTSTSNPNFKLSSQPSEKRPEKPRQKSVRTQSQNQTNPLFIQRSIKKIQTITHQFKTTTDSTESQNRNGTTGTSNNDSNSQKSYMRHTSNSEKRQRSRSKTLQIKSSIVNKNRQKVNQPIKQLAASYIQTTNELSDRSQSPITGLITQESPPRNQTDMKKLIKLLNKPEMLLLSHLQNQIKYYYPQRMNQHLKIQQPTSNQPKTTNFMETVEKQRKIINEQTSNSRQRQNQESKPIGPSSQQNQKQRVSNFHRSTLNSYSNQPASVTTSNVTPKRDSVLTNSSSNTIQPSQLGITSSKSRKSKMQIENSLQQKKPTIQHSDKLQKTKPSKDQFLLPQESCDSQKFVQKMESFDQSNDSGIPIVSATNNANSQNAYTTFF